MCSMCFIDVHLLCVILLKYNWLYNNIITSFFFKLKIIAWTSDDETQDLNKQEREKTLM